MIKIGITGGIGSGKTTVCKLFEQFKIPVYYADDKAKNILVNNKECKANVIHSFGPKSYFEDGSINRKFLSEIVFSDKNKVEILNKIVHPLVAIDFDNWIDTHENHKIVIKEAALLFETGQDKELDKIIVVDAPEELRIKRVLARDKHRTEEQIKSIIEKQMPQKEKNKRADFLILNSGENLKEQVLQIYTQLNEQY